MCLEVFRGIAEHRPLQTPLHRVRVNQDTLGAKRRVEWIEPGPGLITLIRVNSLFRRGRDASRLCPPPLIAKQVRN